MKNYPFSFNQLKEFSESNPYLNFDSSIHELYLYLKMQQEKLNFPAVTDDIGNMLRFLVSYLQPKSIFEFGSGYGQSAFWYLLGSENIDQVYLCEKRDDLLQVFEKAPWPKEWISKMDYHQGDAFERFEQLDTVDWLLIDGVKADYLQFLKMSREKISNTGLVIIDNSYWRGSFLDEELSKNKRTAKNIKELHHYIKSSSEWDAIFIPYVDGVTLLKPI